MFYIFYFLGKLLTHTIFDINKYSNMKQSGIKLTFPTIREQYTDPFWHTVKNGENDYLHFGADYDLINYISRAMNFKIM